MRIVPLDGRRATEIATLAKRCGVYVPGDEDCGRIATAGKTLLGFVVWQTVLDEATLLAIAVGRERRRQGIGGSLLDSAIAVWRAAAIEKVFLEVRAANLAAQALYRGRGFILYRRRMNYYHCGLGREDALLMRKEIDGDGRDVYPG